MRNSWHGKGRILLNVDAEGTLRLWRKSGVDANSRWDETGSMWGVCFAKLPKDQAVPQLEDLIRAAQAALDRYREGGPHVLYCEDEPNSDDHQWMAVGFYDESGFTFTDPDSRATCPTCGSPPYSADPIEEERL